MSRGPGRLDFREPLLVPWKAPHPHSAPPTHTLAWGPCLWAHLRDSTSNCFQEKLEKLTKPPLRATLPVTSHPDEQGGCEPARHLCEKGKRALLPKAISSPGQTAVTVY